MVTRRRVNGFSEPVDEVVDSTVLQEEVSQTFSAPVTPVTVKEEPPIVKKVEPVAPEPAPKQEVVKQELVEPRHPRNVPRFTEVAQ